MMKGQTLIVFLLLPIVSKALDCALPIEGVVNQALIDEITAGVGDPGATITIRSDNPYYTCQVQGNTMDTYQELSLVMEYTDIGGDKVGQFEMICINDGINPNNLWNRRLESLMILSTGPGVTYDGSIGLQTDCSSCINTAGNDNNCVACHADCSTGLMRCTGDGTADCCLAFDPDGNCQTTTDCTTPNFIANAQNNWKCACGITLCNPGYSFMTPCSCPLSNICLSNQNPCLNDGTCNLNNAPDDYTCDCTGTHYTGPTCSVCNYPCGSGYEANAACADCDLTNICLSDQNPCMNGGSCTLVTPPDQYTCDCTGTHYTGTNCTECAYPCSDGYTPNSTCDGCVLSDTCIANTPCQNGGSCILNAAPDNYTCTCMNEFDPVTDCTVCGKSCDPGYTNNTECDDCVLSDICEADNPCQNGGTCTLDSVPDEFSCSCLNSFTATSNCTECSLSCPDGYVKGPLCNECILSDICLAHSPCQNGATCQLGSTPTNFTCACTNFFDSSTNCSECSLDCQVGYEYDDDCTGCYLSDICLAEEPCLNGASCLTGPLPHDYTCNCTNQYAGVNCSECPVTCNVGYDVAANCNGCELVDTCLAHTPCQNGGTCALTTPPDQYECTCINQFDNSTDCKTCLVVCDNGYSPNSVCSECELTSICEAITPCKNNGECILGTSPDLYQCNCDRSFFEGTNCTDCTEQCTVGYELNLDSCTCELKNICVAETPCENGGTCSLVDSSPDQYQCQCRNQFQDEHCSTCGLECNDGAPDSDCKSCDCHVGYTGEYCTIVDNCARSNGCNGRGICINHEVHFECNCSTGATGARCESCIEEYEPTGLNRECEPIPPTVNPLPVQWYYVAVPAIALMIFIAVNTAIVFFYIVRRGGNNRKANA